jgi:hypothetical protein
MCLISMEADMAAKSNTKSNAKPAKRVAGVRIPKSYRGAVNKIVELSRNPVVIEVAAAGLVAAAGALVRNRGVRAAAGKAGATAWDAASETAEVAGRTGRSVVAAAAKATRRLKPQSEDTTPAETSTKRRAAPAGKRRAVPLDTKDGAMPYVS